MILLQPHADDSGSDPQSHTYVFGGLIASPSQWLAFTHDWQAALDSGPIKLAYFKMTEAMSLTGQFALNQGWRRPSRDAKLAELVGIILKHTGYAAWVSMRQADFRKHLRSIPLPVRNTMTDTPHLFLMAQFVLMLCEHAKRHNADCSFEFVFDQQTEIEQDAARWWAHIKDIAAQQGLDRYLGPTPSFRDEKDILPLQAADLFAWEHRNYQTKTKVLWVPPSSILRRLNEIPTINVKFSDAALASISRILLLRSAEYSREHPGEPMLFAGKKSRQRSKKALKKASSGKKRG